MLRRALATLLLLVLPASLVWAAIGGIVPVTSGGGGGVTLNSITLSNNSVTGPFTGTVGVVTVNTTGGAFSGTLALSTASTCAGAPSADNGSFALSTTASPSNLTTTSLANGTYKVCASATQGGATGSPLYQAFTITAAAAGAATQVSTFQVFNSGGSSVANQQITWEQPFQTGDVASGEKIQLRKNDGTTLLTTQEDACSTWAQDGSRKACRLSFVEPDTITAGSNATYQIWKLSGSPHTTANVTTANITANTNIILKATASNGTLDTGTWDFIGVNNVINTCTQWNPSTGYGANPTCGWEVYATGPNTLGLHLFSYAIRESDSAVHKWLRTDAWIDFWGSGSTPCPCSIATRTTQPNTFGAVAAGTVGAATEPGYTHTATLVNGANTLINYGGASDTRVTTFAPSAFNTSTGVITLASGNWLTTHSGNSNISPNSAVPVTISSSGSLPSGLAANTVYWFSPLNFGTNQAQLWPNECSAAGGTPNIPNCSGSQVTFSTQGSGTITITPMIAGKPFGGWMGLDAAANRLWVNTSGTVAAAPTVLVGHNFSYLSQNTKAIPPYINGLSISALSAPAITYFPGFYALPWDLNTTGDGVGDERIGFIDHSGIYALYLPGDPVADQNSRVMGAGSARFHIYHYDETVGQPVVVNNGPAKNGVTYTALGTVQPTARTYPFSTSPWLSPSTAAIDVDGFSERYAVWADSSHLPAPFQAPLLKTGQPEWEDGLVHESISTLANGGGFGGGCSTTGLTPSTIPYYRVIGCVGNGGGGPDNQTRGAAWGVRVLTQANYFQPASSPISQYFHDLVKDNGDFFPDWVTNQATSTEKALGYIPSDVRQGATNYQPWQDDFVFLTYGLEAWRNEYASYNTFVTTYLYKNVITRMDAASSVGSGGCLWAGPSRTIYPFSSGTSLANLATDWPTLYVNASKQTQSQVTASISGTTLNVSALLTGFVQIGQLIQGSGVTAGTIITAPNAQGRVGNWTVNNSQTVGSETMSNWGNQNGWPSTWTDCAHAPAGLITDCGITSPLTVLRQLARSAGQPGQRYGNLRRDSITFWQHPERCVALYVNPHPAICRDPSAQLYEL